MHHLSENKFHFLLFFSNRQLFQSQINPLSHFSCKNAKIFSVSEKKKRMWIIQFCSVVQTKQANWSVTTCLEKFQMEFFFLLLYNYKLNNKLITQENNWQINLIMEIIHSCSPKLDIFNCHVDNFGYEKLFSDILKTNHLISKIIVPIINKIINHDFFLV